MFGVKAFFLCYVIFVDIMGLWFIIDRIREVYTLMKERLELKDNKN